VKHETESNVTNLTYITKQLKVARVQLFHPLKVADDLDLTDKQICTNRY